MENYKDNYKNLPIEKSPIHNRQNIEDKKLYIVSKHKIKSKTPGKLISSKHKLPEPRPDIVRPNIEIISKLNEKSDKNLDNIYPNIYSRQKKNISTKKILMKNINRLNQSIKMIKKK